MAETVNERLRDLLVRHAVEGERYSRGLAQDIVNLLNASDQELLDKLAARLAQIKERGFDTGPATTKRLKILIADLHAINSQVYTRLANRLEDELVELAKLEAEFQAGALKSSIPVSVQTAVPAPALLRTLVKTAPMEGALLKSWTDGMEQGRLRRIEAEIRKGLVAGEGTDDIVRRIKGTRANGYRDGVLQISRRSAQSIVRTATTHVSNVAAQATYAANERVVKGWAFLATLDSRTTITCAGLSGNVYPIGEGPMPPRHIRCRSCSMPVTKSFREMGFDSDDVTPAQRASMDGQVPGDITFDQWLKQKGDKTQDTVLGPTRAKLFRDGKLKLDDLIKDDGTVLTLEQLRRKHKDILG